MSTVKNAVKATDVIKFFETADLDLAELALSLASDKVASRTKASKEASDRMAKARASRGKAKAPAGGEATPPAQAGQLTNEQASPIAQARARRATAGVASVPAPAHTAEATSVAADNIAQ